MRILSCLVLGFVVGCGRCAVAQVAVVGQPADVRLGQNKAAKPRVIDWASAGNYWRSKPVDLSTQVDPVLPELRKTRNVYWSRLLAERLALEKQGLHLKSAGGLPMRLDPVLDAQGVLVVAKFEGYTVVPVDPSDLVMYTEMHFRIERVIQQQKAMSLSPGSVIDIDLIGGSLKTPSGELKSFDLSPESNFMQPGSTYMMMLRYFNPTSSYFQGAFWKVENGRLVSGYNPKSAHIGRTVDDVASRLMHNSQK